MKRRNAGSLISNVLCFHVIDPSADSIDDSVSMDLQVMACDAIRERTDEPFTEVLEPVRNNFLQEDIRPSDHEDVIRI